MKKELQEILALLKTGKTKREDFTFQERLGFLLKLIILLFISYLFIIGVTKLFNYYGFDLPNPDKFDKMKDKSAAFFIFAGVIFAPIFEELIFRFPLRYSKLYVSILAGYIVYLIISLGFNFKLYIFLIGIMSVAFSIIFYNNTPDKVFARIRLFWRKNPLIIFYVFGLSFSYFHLNNYSEITTKIVLLSPILLLTKFTATIILSYARLKSGIGYSIVLHMLNNGIAILFYLLSR